MTVAAKDAYETGPLGLGANQETLAGARPGLASGQRPPQEVR
jgi:hypothetical protein